MQVTLNSLNLNTGWYSLEDIQFDSSPPLEFSDLSFASADGAKFISSKYTPKTLTLRGRITQSTVALLEAEMDNFKKSLLSNPNINLNFSYANGYRQYVGNVQNLTLTRKHFNITYVPFEITFIAEDPPFAQEIASLSSIVPNLNEVFSADGIVGNTYSHTLTMSGTAQPLAKWTYLLDSVSGRIEQLVFKSITTGKQLELNAALSAGDELVIDQENLEVTLNSFAQNYEGVFPSFNLGGNELQWQIYGSGTEKLGSFLDQSNSAGNSAIQFGLSELGELFTAGSSGVFDKISFLIKKFRYTTSLIATARLYSVSGGLPATLLQTVILDLQNLNVNSATWVDFLFNYSSFVSGSDYVVTLQFNSAPVSDSVQIYTSGNIYSSGYMVYKQYNSANWTIIYQQEYDVAFKTYLKTSTTSVFNHTSSLKVEQKKRFL